MIDNTDSLAVAGESGREAVLRSRRVSPENKKRIGGKETA